LPKHVVDGNWMYSVFKVAFYSVLKVVFYSVLKVVFSLALNTDIDWFFSKCSVNDNKCAPDDGSVRSATCKTLIF
jgi:hypothetical protein